MVNRILIAGAGISGLTAALHLAEKGCEVILADKTDVTGGLLPVLDLQFPNDHCGMCRILPMIDREGAQDFCLKRGVFHDNITFLPHTLVADVTGNPGKLEVTLESLESLESLEHLEHREDDAPEPMVVRDVAAVLLAGGGALFDPSDQVVYGRGELNNVVTALEFERDLAGSSDYRDIVPRPSDGQPAAKIAWLQCVGSRNLMSGSPWCASACCMFSVKEALHVKRITRNAADAAIFYMDMRTFGRDYQRYRDQAEKEAGIRFVRCRIHSIEQAEDGHDLLLYYVDENGQRQAETFSMAVLATGKAPSEKETEGLDRLAGVKGVFPLQSAVAFRDISDSVKGALAVTAEVDSLMASMDPSVATGAGDGNGYPDNPALEAPPRFLFLAVETDLPVWDEISAGIRERYGTDLMRVPDLADTEPIQQAIVRDRINRVVLLAEYPWAALPTARGLSRLLGLPPAFIHVADISPYFIGQAEDTVARVMGLAEKSVAMLHRAQRYPEIRKPLVRQALIVGSGPAGMAAAKTVADAGHQVVLVEKSQEVGGNMDRISGKENAKVLNQLKTRILDDPNITIHTGFILKEVRGTTGEFKAVAVSDTSDPEVIGFGAAAVATGGSLRTPGSYEYGNDERIITLSGFSDRVDQGDLVGINHVAMILCADSRQEPFNYCSRICCMKALTAAVRFKETHPDARVTVFYRDIMTYGRSEALYTRARELGVFFIPFEPGREPRVSLEKGGLSVKILDRFSGFDMGIQPDLICLAPGVAPASGREMSGLFGLALTPDGFVKEADYKWRPVDTHRSGIFVCGLARAPGRIQEILEDGRAAGARINRLFARESLACPAVSARVRDAACSRCRICIDTCPYGARYVNTEDDRVMVDAAACQGCGSCAVACPNSATIMSGFEDKGLMEAMEALF